MSEALNLMRGIVSETETGFGAALYIHDLDTENGGPADRVESTAAKSESR
jgi:hypothetical protein